MRWKAEDLSPEQRSQIVNSWAVPVSEKISKYKARKDWEDGIQFDSKLEADCYRHLKLLKAAGEIAYFLRQVVFHLPGGVKHRVDFMVVRRGQEPIYGEAKGYDLPIGRIKRKQVEELYGVHIHLWSKPHHAGK